MTMTDLSSIQLPTRARRWLTDHTRDDLLYGWPVEVNLSWWNAATAAVAGGPVTGRAASRSIHGEEGEDGKQSVMEQGRATIRRQDLFTLAAARPSTEQDILTLMWHVLAWGSGLKPRQNRNRIRSLTANPVRTAEVLLQAAELSTTEPASAYQLLRPGRRTAFPSLGPAFFTKYLYFAGAGRPDHRSLILDARVATALNRNHGWTSLGSSAWPAITYERYSGLLGSWAEQASRPRAQGGVGRPVAADELELFLFAPGPRQPASPRRRGRDQ